MKTTHLSALAVLLLASNLWADQETKEKEKPNVAVLTTSRSYDLTVEKVEPTVFVSLETRWTFADHKIPKPLLAALKASDALKPTPQHELLPHEQAVIKDSRTGRWRVEQKGKKNVTATLRYLIGDEHAEIQLLVHLTLDHTLGKAKPKRDYSFGELEVALDLDSSVISTAQWGKLTLPDRKHKDKNVRIENNLRVNFTGTFAKETIQAINSLNRILPDEASRLRKNLWQHEYTNDSHYGIHLLWTDAQHVYHGFMLVQSRKRDDLAFWYNMSGPAWPLKYARMQLDPLGWPLVLSGHEFVGQTEDGVSIFRPVQLVLSRKTVDKPQDN